MTEQALQTWLKQQQPVLDHIIARAGHEFHDQHKGRSNFAFDLAECQYESFNLIRNKDLCYDRPNTAFCYSLWYHGRRVNTFLSHFAKAIFNSRGSEVPIDIFDLGAGTGAVQWAIGLVYHKMKEAAIKMPEIRIVNVDTSPFMLHYSRHFLWKHFLEQYKHCRELDEKIDYEVNSWSNRRSFKVSNPWITASYLFDISDMGNGVDEYKKAVLEGFNEIIAEYNPSKLLLLTSLSKEHLVDEVSRTFNDRNFVVEKIRSQSLILSGSLEEVNKLRAGLFHTYKAHLDTNEAIAIRNPANWNDVSFIGTIITRRKVEMFSEAAGKNGLKIHNASLKARKYVELNEEQRRAAGNVYQPSVIIGPAGCGKSIVITERIKNIVEEAKYHPDLKILLTTFNKELLGQLARWLTDILEYDKFRIEYDTNYYGQNDKSGKIYFNGSNVPNIRLLHFDMLPKVLGGVPYWGVVDDARHKAILIDIIGRIKAQYRITDTRFDNILNPEFLLEEYHRVIYGLQVGISGAKETYLTVSRRGRGLDVKLDKNSDRRKLVWECLENYANYVYNARVPGFTIRRQLFLNKLKSGQLNITYDYVVVDEFQDCTKADFEIFFHLLKDPNHLVISGDLAQAVHLGRSANIEMLREAIRQGRHMNDINWNYLSGSYRLPFRICEAIKTISEYIYMSFGKNRAASILTPYKGAPPGARPIVVFGKSEIDMATKIREIIEHYKHFNLSEKCILEKDEALRRQLQLDSDSVLRLKGLEKHCVIWSTRANFDFKRERFEFVYTILSRTSSILIIALFQDGNTSDSGTQEAFKEAIGLLNKERLIFWDRETKNKFNLFCKGVQAPRSIDEEE